jgi:hypothetical protein
MGRVRYTFSVMLISFLVGCCNKEYNQARTEPFSDHGFDEKGRYIFQRDSFYTEKDTVGFYRKERQPYELYNDSLNKIRNK